MQKQRELGYTKGLPCRTSAKRRLTPRRTPNPESAPESAPVPAPRRCTRSAEFLPKWRKVLAKSALNVHNRGPLDAPQAMWLAAAPVASVPSAPRSTRSMPATTPATTIQSFVPSAVPTHPGYPSSIETKEKRVFRFGKTAMQTPRGSTPRTAMTVLTVRSTHTVPASLACRTDHRFIAWNKARNAEQRTQLDNPDRPHRPHDS